MNELPDIKSHLQGELNLAESKDSDKKVTVKWSSKYKDLVEVEDYLKEKLESLDVEGAFDVTAIEPLYFKTLNYTTYAGFVIIHPLNFEQSLRQMIDAYADNMSGKHIEFIKSNLNNSQTANKYILSDDPYTRSKKALVVLPGGNKLKKHMCVGKIQKILDKHGKANVLFKKHPISYDDGYEELDEYLGGIEYASGYCDLNSLIEQSEYVYTSMISETALTANILGKKVDHFDLFQNRETTSFGHINYYLFTTKDPVAWASQAFASPKSGVIHPLIDTFWKDKVDNYLDYILELREFYKDAYVR